MDAPERIWATEDAANFGEDKFHTTRPMSGLTEYIRADLCADPALLAEAVEVLREARTDLAAYVDHDYPPETCATYPSVARQHHRDMELCRRIDAFLAKLENRHDR